MTTLQEKLEELMVARDEATLAGTRYREAFDAWMIVQGEEREYDRRQTKERVAALETEAKELALAEYHKDENKHPSPGVEIKMNKVVDYYPDLALRWAQEHKLALIPEKLDVKKYEALVLSKDAPGEVSEKPVAQIARDLPKALKGD